MYFIDATTSPQDILRKLGADHLLTSTELCSVEGIQITKEVDRRLTIDVRIGGSNLALKHYILKPEGWEELHRG